MQEFFAVAAPGLEAQVAAELQALGHAGKTETGGVTFRAPYEALVPLHRQLRVTSRILLRVASFRCVHLAELTKLTRRIRWSDLLKRNAPVRVKATCRKSKIYHSGAAAQRVHEGISQVMPLPGLADKDDVNAQEILLRIERDMCELSINASGEHLHVRGYKLQTAKAPLRETLAAGLLSMCEWTPNEALIDPMCGSGTFVLEAARQAAKILPNASRSFACEAWPIMRSHKQKVNAPLIQPQVEEPRIYAFDRDEGAIASTRDNAARAGVPKGIITNCQTLSSLKRPDCEPGLVICNPPWGERIGERKQLRNLYASLGRIMQEELSGWRLGLVTSQPMLAEATGLKFTSVSEPLMHGGMRIRLYRF